MRISESIKKYKLQIVCVTAGFFLYALAMIFRPAKENEELSYVTRNGYGASTSEDVYVSGLSEEEVLLEIPVKARRFSDDEIDAAFDRCMDDLQEEILGNNDSLQEVYTDLDLPDRKNDYGFSLEWDSDRKDLLSFDGTVKNENLTEAAEVHLELIMRDGSREARYTLPVRILPQRLTEQEAKIKRFLTEINSRDEQAASEEQVRLPNKFEGKEIHYRSTESTDLNFIWIAGILAAVLLYVRKEQRQKETQEKKYKQMQMDYPEIVSKLMVFIGAGMSVRGAWESIARDYEVSGDRKRYAYEEICRMCSRLKTGESESRVYRDFGRTCRSKQYMKLASLLEQDRKSGTANLRSILAVEMVEAWEERKNLARRQGEEAGTKLLLPLVMMLGIVMAIIMVPAFMSF